MQGDSTPPIHEYVFGKLFTGNGRINFLFLEGINLERIGIIG